ncbi:unnamed protein product [Urochloa humidicola]
MAAVGAVCSSPRGSACGCAGPARIGHGASSRPPCNCRELCVWRLRALRAAADHGAGVQRRPEEPESSEALYVHATSSQH